MERCLDELECGGVLSDARYAEALARQRVQTGYGPLRILHELRERGVDEERAREALAAYAEEWHERASAARRKRFGERAPRAYQERARQARFLEYRGFNAEQIRAALGAAR